MQSLIARRVRTEREAVRPNDEPSRSRAAADGFSDWLCSLPICQE